MTEEVKNENIQTEEVNKTQIIENEKAEVSENEKSDSKEEVSVKKEEVKTEGKSQDSQQTRRPYNKPGRDYQDQQRFPKFRKKICKFCYEKNLKIDYKNSDVLEHFITDRGKILPRRVTGTCSKHQRLIARAIKRARIIALLPFVEQ